MKAVVGLYEIDSGDTVREWEFEDIEAAAWKLKEVHEMLVVLGLEEYYEARMRIEEDEEE